MSKVTRARAKKSALSSSSSMGNKNMSKPQKLNDTFMSEFYRQVPAEDLEGWKAGDLSRVSSEVLALAKLRKPGRPIVQILPPAHDSTLTVIQIVNDDMPFLVDSVSSELAFHGLHMNVLFHPVLHVTRSADGELTEIAGVKPDKGTLAESYMYIQLEQVLTPDAARKLTDRLVNVLKDVRLATSEWRDMLKKADSVIEDLSQKVGADNKESAEFMSYLRHNNFTFLGYRTYELKGETLRRARDSDMGVMKTAGDLPYDQLGDVAVQSLKKCEWPVMVTKLIETYSSVHRRVPMDAVSVRIHDAKGNLIGAHVFVGLFTSSTYSCRTSDIPIVREKVIKTVERAGFNKGSHAHKALEHILEKMPRDELFHVSTSELYNLALGILRLQEKHRIALFTHKDSMKQYMSCLVYVPRDRYNTKFRHEAIRTLEEALDGKATNYFTTLDDSPLARLLFTVRLKRGADAKFDPAAAEQKLLELGREWDERLKHVLVSAFGKREGGELAAIYGQAFNAAYQDSMDIKNVVHDIRQLEALFHHHEKIRIEFYQRHDAGPGDMHAKVYHTDVPVALSDILPVLENFGLRGISEMPYRVELADLGRVVWIQDFKLLAPSHVSLGVIKKNLEETFLQVWHGHAENDALNQMVSRANLDWREVMVLRAYSSFMRQARFPYSRSYIEQVVNSYPDIAREIVELFKAKHNPTAGSKSASMAKQVNEKIDLLLQGVQKLDHDRILRSLRTLVEVTLRTNFYQKDAQGNAKSVLAVKLDSKNIVDLPLPRPHVEIFVYSNRVEAVHLRFGEIARGGIRWSDRHEDFRTEVLGLVKSQMVKNTVIVPVGAKGGFVVKQPPKTGGREAYQQEGIACYKIFVQALLDLTDNNVKGKIVRPKDIVCHDSVDPYLVVAADKGTATFSDIANGISVNAGFWLGDAFASGGSSGYDHKKIGITARGGWESVKRHFREIGKDIQSEDFTVTGVGDMAGDVFGNAMLLSKHIKLVGAFNHVHIFCDPNPDISASYAERERLFGARGGWDAYDKSKISKGGGVFDRSAKTLKLSPEIKKCFEIDENEVTPDVLIRAILKANVELIWFGGIGTFLKSSKQSHADADDKTNDSLRIDARDVRAKVIGEGANLGLTQLARVEYAENGGRLNTDFIDNSAGVDCSDHEVNIKILLSDVMSKGKMTLEQRNKLLEQMTEDVSALVLADNYQQTQSISLQESQAKDQLGLHAELIRDLEKSGMIKRHLEGLPDEETLARLGREGKGLSRPELCILMSWAKITLYNQVIQSTIPDDPSLEWALFSYFPKALHKFPDEIRGHKLRREIVATQVVNTLVNRMGSVFVHSRMAKFAVGFEKVVRSFIIVSEVFDLYTLWKTVESLDNKVPCEAQITALHEIFLVVKRMVAGLLRSDSASLDLQKEIDRAKPAIRDLSKSISQVLPSGMKEMLTQNEQKMIARGTPVPLAKTLAGIKVLSSASDIISIASHQKGDVKSVASAYFQVGERLHLNWLRSLLSDIVPANNWQARVMSGLQDETYMHQSVLASSITKLLLKKGANPEKVTKDWFDDHQSRLTAIDEMVSQMKVQNRPELDMAVLISQRIGQLVNSMQ